MEDSKKAFELRKQGKLEEALQLARRLVKAEPQDEWNVRALAWTLYDLTKREVDQKDTQKARAYFQELQQLELPENDEVLQDGLDRCQRMLDPRWPLLDQARQASQNGEHDDALRLYRAIVKQHRDWEEAQYGLGWEIMRQLQPLVATDPPPISSIVKLLREYGRLKAIHRPDKLHSIILSMATRVAERYTGYIKFVEWWDLENLREEDYQPGGDGFLKDYPSLVEDVIKALYKAAKDLDLTGEMAWIVSFVGENYGRFPDREWFPFYYGTLLTRAGRTEEARDLILPFVRVKQSEAWAWHRLGETFTDNDGHERRACLCRALLCSFDEDYVPNLRIDLAEQMLSSGDLAEAKCECLKVIQSKEWLGHRIPDRLQELIGGEWFKTTEPTDDNQVYYEIHAPTAETILVENLDWHSAVITRMKPTKEGKPAKLFVGILVGNALKELNARQSEFLDFSAMPVGAPCEAKWESLGEQSTIVELRKREGELWDIVPVRRGIISHVNKEKGVTKVLLSPREFCLFHSDRFPSIENLEAGTLLDVQTQHDRVKRRHFPLGFAPASDDALPDSCQVVKGAIMIRDGKSFGFVNDCYVSPDIIREKHLQDGDHLEGIAAQEFNTKKGRTTWTFLRPT